MALSLSHTHTKKKTKQNSQGKKQKNGDQTTTKKDSLKKPQQKKSSHLIFGVFFPALPAGYDPQHPNIHGWIPGHGLGGSSVELP